MDTEWAAWSTVFVRLGIGIIMVVHGAGKILQVGPASKSIAAFSKSLAGLGVPAPTSMAWIVGFVELLGGAFLIIGFLTQIAALLIAIDMAAAAMLVHIPNGFLASKGGTEFVLLLIFASVALLFSGAGPISADRTVFGRDHLLSRGGS